MNQTKYRLALALALGLFLSQRALPEGAEGHGCPDFHLGDCHALEGDRVDVSLNYECMSAGVATVTRQGHQAVRRPMQSTIAREPGYPDAYYGKDFLLLLNGEEGVLDTAVDGQRVSRKVHCDLNPRP